MKKESGEFGKRERGSTFGWGHAIANKSVAIIQTGMGPIFHVTKFGFNTSPTALFIFYAFL